MPLTDLQARKAPPGAKDYKLADSGGLHLFVTKKGHKSWRLKYRFDGKEKRLLLGAYPEVSLAKAREMRDEAKRLLRDERDPLLERHKRRIGATAAAAATFEIYALRWHEAQKERWSPVHVRKVEQALRRDVLPDLGCVPISEIDGPMLLRVLRKVEARGAVDTAKRIRQHLSAVFQFAMAEGVASVDPAAGIVKGLRPTPPAGQQPAVRTMEEAREILRTMDASTSDPQTKFASRLLALTAVRPGIVRAAAWSEFEGVDWADTEAPCPDAVWRIPAVRMKLEQDDKTDKAFEHLVPLPAQAVDVLRQMRRLTGTHELVFLSVRSSRKPMSENTIGYMYARNGYSGRHVPHGWRATFSTVMNERAVASRRLEDRPIIDGMLAHKLKGVSGSEMAYNRALHWDRRRELATEWADLLMTGLRPAGALLA
jgi:integrase